MLGFDDLLTALSGEGQLVHAEQLPARPARFADLATRLPDTVAAAFPERFWTHQAAAIDLARAGRHVVVATGTASGKSRCYQVPIAEAVSAPAKDRGTALLLYPTKALAQDQLRALASLDVDGLTAVTYDGDTPPERRVWARRHASVVLTNPDMLHVGILPSHARWSAFLGRLRYVVVDELHTLRGIFGSHVAHVLRRLRRVAAHYGADPTFVFGSATIGRPGVLASALCGAEVGVVDDDGSPRGERVFALWNPPLVDESTGTRASANGQAAELLASLVEEGYRAIAFTRSRKSAELVARYARGRLPSELAAAVRPYRAGYLASERRDIEAQLFSGQLRGVAATNALELGIDVGALDACILDGFPGTIASLWQQAGRAGRAQQRSLAVLVAGEDQLDQWFMAHPRELFTRSPEPAVVNPSNPFVLLPHLGCAAYELPLTPDDERWWGDDLDDGIRELVLDDRLVLRNGRAVWSGGGAPAPDVGLRTGSSDEYRIVAEAPEDDGRPEGSASDEGQPSGKERSDAERGHQRVSLRMIGTVDGARAFEVVHPGAVYLHQGTSYVVDRLDVDDRAAWVREAGGEHDEYTQPRSTIDFRILDVESSVDVGRASLSLGALEVTEQVTGYQRISVSTHEVVERVDLDLPPTRLVTRAFWYTVSERVLADAGVTFEAVPGTLHAAEHAAIGLLPLFTICDRWDVGGVSTAWHGDTGLPTIVIYDGYPGGAGIAELGFAAASRHLAATLEAVERCPCDTGCPSCVQSPKCGNWNEPLDKAGATAFLRTVLGG